MGDERAASDDLLWKIMLLSSEIDEELPNLEKLEGLRLKLNERKVEDLMEKYARWTDLEALSPNLGMIHRILRTGPKGKGEKLGSYAFWPDSPKSVEAGKRIAAHIEKNARLDGYQIVGED